jgi:uncharacterized protein (TIGR03067 family)
MIRSLVLSLALLGALLCACGTHGPATPADGPDDELRKFQGTWIITAYTKDGKPDDAMKGAAVTIEGNKFTVKIKDQATYGYIKIDGTKSPKSISATYTDGPNKGKTFPGIYKFDGDTLIDCYSEPGKEPPTEFKSEAGSGWRLIVHKREQK